LVSLHAGSETIVGLAYFFAIAAAIRK